MPKSSGGGGSGGRSGGGVGSGDASEQLMSNLKSGKLSIEESVAAERATYRASSDAFFKEKNYDKAGELEKRYKVMHEVNEKFKLEQAAKNVKIDWNKVTTRNGPSVRDDDNAGGRRDLTSDFAKRMAKMRREGA
ncbi:MAG: hypothetical protein WC455_12615 [Dehalococcoidia bacterium]|jgi:hypothetical protein